jgi:hypothetical protein
MVMNFDWNYRFWLEISNLINQTVQYHLIGLTNEWKKNFDDQTQNFNDQTQTSETNIVKGCWFSCIWMNVMMNCFWWKCHEVCIKLSILTGNFKFNQSNRSILHNSTDKRTRKIILMIELRMDRQNVMTDSSET